MRSSTTLALLCSALVTAQDLPQAEPVNDNPVATVYKATLPDDPFFTAGSLDGNVKGSFVASTTDDGLAVQWKVELSNLPSEGGPFMYHIHVEPVPSSGNCTATLAHLDPTERGEEPVCDPSKPASCQVGDLSGKQGSIDTTSYTAEYLDEFTTTKEGLGAFFGNRSIVIHFANKTRITCANFEIQDDGFIPATNESFSAPSYLPTPTATAGSGGDGATTPVPTAAASKLIAGVPVALAGVAAMLFAL